MQKTVCCFFGHHDVTDDIKGKLQKVIRSLIINDNAVKFFVGNHGRFDYEVYMYLREIRKEYPDIEYYVVLAYMPNHKSNENYYFEPNESIFPYGFETVPKKCAIIRRNDWMLKQSDTVVCYVNHYIGGSGQMIEKANKQNKRVINLATTQ